MDFENRRPRPGFVSDTDDMLYDIDEIDRKNEGILTEAKVDSIRQFARLGGVTANVEYLARNFSVSVEDVERVVAAME